MSFRFLYVLLLTGFSAFAQNYPCYINRTSKVIMADFHDLGLQNEKYRIVLVDSGRVIRFNISGHEKIECEFEMDSLDRCEASTFTYCCSDCSENHINKFLHDRYYGWKKVAPNHYVSKRKRQTDLEIYNSNTEVTVLKFTRRTWTKRDYTLMVVGPNGTPASSAK